MSDRRARWPFFVLGGGITVLVTGIVIAITRGNGGGHTNPRSHYRYRSDHAVDLLFDLLQGRNLSVALIALGVLMTAVGLIVVWPARRRNPPVGPTPPPPFPPQQSPGSSPHER